MRQGGKDELVGAPEMVGVHGELVRLFLGAAPDETLRGK
jgi:hypothetical protein